MVFNTRGGSLYLSPQLTDITIAKLFKAGKASMINNLTFQPDTGEPIVIGSVHARFLKFTHTNQNSGVVLRFVHLTDSQLDTLNELGDRLPNVGDREDSLIQTVMVGSFNNIPQQ